MDSSLRRKRVWFKYAKNIVIKVIAVKTFEISSKQILTKNF